MLMIINRKNHSKISALRNTLLNLIKTSFQTCEQCDYKKKKILIIQFNVGKQILANEQEI